MEKETPEDERSPEQHRRWNEFMEHVGTPPQGMGENEDGDFVIDWPRVRFTMHIKPRPS